MTTITVHPDTGKQTHGSAGREHARKRAHSAPEGARSAPVQRDTINASGAGQSGEERVPSGKLSRVQLEALSDLQRLGYERVGKLDRVKNCGTVPIVNGRVALGVTESGGVQCQGLARCGSRWCPHCWGKIAKARAEDIKQVATWANEQGYSLVLATLTAAHVTTATLDQAGGDERKAVMEQNVKTVFDGLSGAWRYAHSGRAGKALKDQRIGYARAFELTVDALGATNLTGTHGHFHVLLVFEPGANLDVYESALWERWRAGCARYGLDTSRQGFDFKRLKVSARNVQAAASYLVKGEKLDADSVGLELARSDQKNGRGITRTTPEGLLRAVGALDSDGWYRLGARALAQWRGIEEACAGRRWLTWSRDLRKLAGLGAEKSDEELANAAEAVEDDAVAVVQYDEVKDHLDEIRLVVRETQKQAQKWKILLLCLDSLGVGYEVTTQTAWTELVTEWTRAKWNPNPDTYR